MNATMVAITVTLKPIARTQLVRSPVLARMDTLEMGDSVQVM